MTAVIVIRQSRRIHLITDGLLDTPVGPKVAAKAFMLPHLPALVALRGPAFVTAFLPFLSAAPTLDDIAIGLPGLLREFRSGFASIFSKTDPLGAEMDIIIAGPSAKHGPVTMFATTSETHGAPTYATHYVSSPVVALPGDHGAQEAIAEMVGDPDACDLRAVAGSLMRRQAEVTGARIGGFVQLSTVELGNSSMRTEVVERWEM
ncbi:hypothetical protein [Ancylobacter terrae]|uniref:hypothetical protein n=1 Tax=Ancylobacter sp. sgz301288 TaxID=3342077 RepID=UPI00385ACE32